MVHGVGHGSRRKNVLVVIPLPVQTTRSGDNPRLVVVGMFTVIQVVPFQNVLLI